MQPKDENKIIIKQWIRVFLLIAVIATIVVSIISIVKSLGSEETTKEKLYTYNYTSNLNYRVYLKDNSFFTTPYLGMNKQYITSLIDHIEVDTRYNFQSDEDLDYTYSYSIVATAKGLYQNTDGKDVEVWSKEYPIASQNAQSGSGKTINIAKTVNVDYNQYNVVMTNFRNQFGLSVDARVDLTMKITISAGLRGESVKGVDTTDTLALEIPLLEQTIKITPNYVNSGGNTVYKEADASAETEINVPLLVFGLILLGVSITIFVKLVKSLLVVTRKSEYVLALNKILKDYADVIAETHNMPDLEQYDVINIKNFNDLVDVEEELHSPILCFEVKENVETVFVIVNNQTVYKFTLRESDFDHFKKD